MTNPTWALLALAVGAFGIGTTEFAPMGLLPVIADGVHVSIPSAGLLISAYALGVMIGAPIMTLLLSRLRAKHALLALVSIFVVGNLLSALAPGYWTLLASRLVTSLNHGAFFGIGSVVAANLVAPEKRASAVATMFMGLTIANIGGVPAATWIGQQIGWRMAFAGTAGLGLLAMAALVIALPRGDKGAMPDIGKELRVLARPAVLMALATTVLGSAATFTLYTYIAPILTTITGASQNFITLALVMIGVGFTIGNGVGGKLADWSLDGATRIFLAAMTAIMLVLPLMFGSHWGALVGVTIWGVAAFAIVPPVQIRVMHAASDAPGLASSVNVGAFNLGNAIGAGLGGAVISSGYGYGAIPVAGAVMAAGGLLLVFAGAARKRGVAPAA
jgi:DHA1 family inner membrane transport protein